MCVQILCLLCLSVHSSIHPSSRLIHTSELDTEEPKNNSVCSHPCLLSYTLLVVGTSNEGKNTLHGNTNTLQKSVFAAFHFTLREPLFKSQVKEKNGLNFPSNTMKFPSSESLAHAFSCAYNNCVSVFQPS